MTLEPTEEQVFEYWAAVENNGGQLRHFLKTPPSKNKFSDEPTGPLIIYVPEEYRDKETQERFIKWKDK